GDDGAVAVFEGQAAGVDPRLQGDGGGEVQVRRAGELDLVLARRRGEGTPPPPARGGAAPPPPPSPVAGPGAPGRAPPPPPHPPSPAGAATGPNLPALPALKMAWTWAWLSARLYTAGSSITPWKPRSSARPMVSGRAFGTMGPSGARVATIRPLR